MTTCFHPARSSGRSTARHVGIRPTFVWLTVVVVIPLVVACSSATTGSIHVTYPIKTPIKHVIVIMQENRSFDSYFGTYPGAAGLPRNASGQFTVCSPDPETAQCVYPYHDAADKNGG